jgi:hypothetical protein
MSYLKLPSRSQFFVTLAAAVLFGAGAAAQTTNSSLSSPSPTDGAAITLVPGEVVGNEQVIRALVRNGTNQFIFVVPDGLRGQVKAEGTFVMISRNMGYSVSVRVIEPAPPQPRLAEALEEQIRREYPQANSLAAFTTTVADQQGTGIQVRQTLAGLRPRLVRVLWVPLRAGLIEFTLDADNTYAATAQAALDMVLLTFRSNEGGRVSIVRRSDKT